MTASFTEMSTNGSLNGTTPVTIVDAPGGTMDNRRLIMLITIENTDTQPVTVTVSLKDTAASTSIIRRMTMAIGDVLTITRVIILDTDTKSVEAVLDGAVTTNEPEFTAHFAEVVS